MPAGAARFPRLRKVSRKAQKGIRNCGFLPAVFRTPSVAADSFSGAESRFSATAGSRKNNNRDEYHKFDFFKTNCLEDSYD
jgi:hypothetical protein